MKNNDIRETSLSERTLSGLGWSYLSTFTKAFLSLLVLVILARLLTPVDFGLLAIAWIFIMLGNRFGQAFVGPAIIQRAELTGLHIQVGFYPVSADRHCHGSDDMVAGPVHRRFLSRTNSGAGSPGVIDNIRHQWNRKCPRPLAAPRPSFQGIDGRRRSGVFHRLRTYGDCTCGTGLWCMVSCLGRDHAQGNPRGNDGPLYAHASLIPDGRCVRQRTSCPAAPDFRWPGHLSSSPGRAATLSSGAGWAPERSGISRGPTS